MRLLIIFVVSLFLFSCGNPGGGSNGTRPIVDQGNENYIGIKWDAPTTNDDGTPLTDLGGFKVYYGFTSGIYSTVVDVGNVLKFYFDDTMYNDFYCFAITAYDISLVNESNYSEELCLYLTR